MRSPAAPAAAAATLVAVDVALLAAGCGRAPLELGRRDLDRLVGGHDAVADAGQEVGDGVGHAHCAILPARLGHAGDVALVRELAQADPAQAELAVDGARPAAACDSACTPRVLYFGGRCWTRTIWEVLAIEFLVSVPQAATAWSFEDSKPAGRPSRANGMPSASSSAKASASVCAVVVMVTSRPRTWSIVVVVDLGEDDLLAHAHRVVAAPVERARVQAPEVADPRDRDGGEAVEELVRALVAQRHGQADRHALAQLERARRTCGRGARWAAGRRSRRAAPWRPRASWRPAWPRRRPC